MTRIVGIIGIIGGALVVVAAWRVRAEFGIAVLGILLMLEAASFARNRNVS